MKKKIVTYITILLCLISLGCFDSLSASHTGSAIHKRLKEKAKAKEAQKKAKKQTKDLWLVQALKTFKKAPYLVTEEAQRPVRKAWFESQYDARSGTEKPEHAAARRIAFEKQEASKTQQQEEEEEEEAQSDAAILFKMAEQQEQERQRKAAEAQKRKTLWISEALFELRKQRRVLSAKEAARKAWLETEYARTNGVEEIQAAVAQRVAIEHQEAAAAATQQAEGTKGPKPVNPPQTPTPSSISSSSLLLATALAMTGAAGYMWYRDQQESSKKTLSERMRDDIERLVLIRIAFREALITQKDYETEIQAILNPDVYSSDQRAGILNVAKKRLQTLISAHDAAPQGKGSLN